MHTKYRNHQNLIKLAKHWAINIDRDPGKFTNYFKSNCNYENLLSDKQITKEAHRIYNAIPKIEYGIPTDFPCYRINISISSGKNNNDYLHIYGKNINHLTKLVKEFKNDYKDSFILVNKITANWLHKEYQWDYVSTKDNKAIQEMFADILNVKTSNYQKEEKTILWLDKKDDLVEKFDFLSFKWALIHKLFIILYLFLCIFYFRNERYWLSGIFTFTFLISALKHTRVVNKEKMIQFRKDLSKL